MSSINHDDNSSNNSDDINSLGEEESAYQESYNESDNEEESSESDEVVHEREQSYEEYRESIGSIKGYIRGDNVTLQGLQERISMLPTDTNIAKMFLEHNILHHYLAYYAETPPEGGQRNEEYPPDERKLEIVEFLLELAPDAVNKVDNGGSSSRHSLTHFSSHIRGYGAYPLHIVCFNADCPSSIIKLLFEKNPSVVQNQWLQESGRSKEVINYGLPLHSYLERSCEHRGEGHHDEHHGWIESYPSFPSGEIEYDIVKMLVDAYPEACASHSREGTPLSQLCRGYDVSLELAQLLTVTDLSSAENACGDNRWTSPIWVLLQNTLVESFPTDAFRYILEYSPSSLEIRDDDKYNCDVLKVIHSETSLNLACKHPNMTAETIRIIIDHQPKMVKIEYKDDGCLPIHTLCKNKELGEQASIDILNLLVTAYPESVKNAVGKKYMYFVPGDEGKYPIRLAEENNKTFEFCKVLLSHRARVSSLSNINILQMACVCNCSLGLFKKLVGDNNELLTRKDGVGHIAMHIAAKYSSLEIVQFLAETEESTISSTDNLGELPLHKACRCGNIHVVEYLLEKNMASVTVKGYQNELPLHILCNKMSKSKRLLQTVEYTETVFKLLVAFPEVCNLSDT